MSKSITKCEVCGANTWAGKPCEYCGSEVRGFAEAVDHYVIGSKPVACTLCTWTGYLRDTADVGNGPICPDCRGEIADVELEQEPAIDYRHPAFEQAINCIDEEGEAE